MPGKLVLKRKPVTVTNSLAPVDVPRRLMRREGEMYVLSTGQVFKASQITPTYIYQLKKKNAYFKGTLIKQKNLIFRKPVVIEIVDQNGKRDDRVTAKAKKRFLSGGFNIWNAMRQAFDDTFCYGISIWNPYIEWQSTNDGMEYYPVELRHLPTRTFESVGMIPSRNKQTTIAKENSSTLFGGIVFNKTTRELEFYQTYDDETTQVKNVVYVKDPSSEDFGGEPLSFPIIPIIEMLKYVWKGNMQSANRMGAPIGFITIAQPKEGDATSDGMSDEDYSAKVLENWGKDTMFVLRENMTITFPNISEGNINNQIIDALEKQIIDYFSPASSISGGGALFGGSNGPELDLVNAYINGIHDWLESAFQPLVQEWLTVNRYDGYTAVVTIPEPEADLTTQNIQKALTGHNTQSLTTNEKRALLDEEELDEEGLKKLKEEYAQPASSGIPGFSYRAGELKELQSKGVMTQTANTFRNERVTGIDGRSDARLLPSQETNSKWKLEGVGEPKYWFTTDSGLHVPVYVDPTSKTYDTESREVAFERRLKQVGGKREDHPYDEKKLKAEDKALPMYRRDSHNHWGDEDWEKTRKGSFESGYETEKQRDRELAISQKTYVKQQKEKKLAERKLGEAQKTLAPDAPPILDNNGSREIAKHTVAGFGKDYRKQNNALYGVDGEYQDLVYYQQGTFRTINSNLRSGNGYDGDLDIAMTKVPPVPKGTVSYRGVGSVEHQEIIRNMNIGDSVNDPAFQSTTLAASYARQISESKNPGKDITVLKYVSDGNQKGYFYDEAKFARDIPPSQYEYEILYDRKINWKVRGKDTYEANGRRYHVITLGV